MMKYLVMENHESHSIVMDEAGTFHRVANMGYEIGDTITEPIFMKSPQRKKAFDVKKLSTIAAIFVCVLLASVPFINNDKGSDVVVYMSINPEVHLEMNKDGEINKLVADNKDGKVLLEGYEYRGKSVSSVLIDLIDRAERLEFLSEGGDIHITVEASDDYKAKEVTVDLSELLKNTYVKKYLIKIRANEDEFCDVEDVTNPMDAETSETSEMTEPSAESSQYNPAGYTAYATAPSSDSNGGTDSAGPTDPTPDDPTDVDKESTSKPTEPTKPTAETKQPTSKPTESKPTDATVPTQPTTEATEPTDSSSESEPSAGEEDDDDNDDGDWEWPWWPWPFNNL